MKLIRESTPKNHHHTGPALQKPNPLPNAFSTHPFEFFPPFPHPFTPAVRARHGKVANNAKGQKTKTASCNNFLIGAEIADGIDAMKGNFGLQAARLLANLLLNANEMLQKCERDKEGVVGVFKAKAQELQVPSKLYKYLFYCLKKGRSIIIILGSILDKITFN